MSRANSIASRTRKGSSITKNTSVPISTKAVQQQDEGYIVQPHPWKACAVLMFKELLAPLIVIAVMGIFQYYNFHFIIQDIGSALDIIISRQAINTVIYYAYFVIIALGVIIMLGHYIPLIRRKNV